MSQKVKKISWNLLKVAQSDPKWPKVAQSGQNWPKAVLSNAKWYEMLQSNTAWDKMVLTSNNVAQSVAKMTICTTNKVVHGGRLHYIPKYYSIKVILEKMLLSIYLLQCY